MKLSRFFILLLVFITSAQNLSAEELRLSDISAGVGVGFGSEFTMLGETLLDSPLVGSLEFQVPMLFKKKFKLEPELGLAYASLSTPGENPAFILFRLGLGGYYVIFKERLAFCLGLRIGINYAKQKEGGVSKTDFDVGPALGVEYFLGEQFSIGALLQLKYIYSGEMGDQSHAMHLLGTQAGVYLRFYFAAAAKKGKRPEAESEKTPVKPQPAEKQSGRLQAEASAKASKPAPAVKKPSGPPVLKCPEDTVEVGAPPPDGYDCYCQEKTETGALGAKQGPYKSWYENGQLASEGGYQNGQRHGSWIFYHSNGQKRLEAGYNQGQKAGTWTHWSREGKKTKEVQH